jgi:hypothetical protein
MNKIKLSSVRIATAVWIIGLVLSGFLLSVPPARVPIFFGLGGIAVIPLVFGSRRYQIFGIAAVVGSLMLAYWEYEAGLRIHAQMERQKLEMHQKDQTTNAPSNEPRKP